MHRHLYQRESRLKGSKNASGKTQHPNHSCINFFFLKKKKNPWFSFTRSEQILSLLSDSFVFSQPISRIVLEREKNQRRVGRGGHTNLQLAVRRAALFPLPQKVNQPPGLFPSSFPPSLLLSLSLASTVALFCFWKRQPRIYTGVLDASHSVVVLFRKHRLSLRPAIKESLSAPLSGSALNVSIRESCNTVFLEIKERKKGQKKEKKKGKKKPRLIKLH